MDDLDQAWVGAVQGRGELEPLAFAQPVVQLERRARGWFAGEDEVGESGEGEDVQLLRRGLGDRERVGSGVDEGGVLHQLIEMRGAAQVFVRRARVEAFISRGLPVEDAHPGRSGIRSGDQGALGREGAMEDALLVHVLEDLGDLPHQSDAGLEAEARPAWARK